MMMFACDVLTSMDDVIFTQNKKILILSYDFFIMKDTHLVFVKEPMIVSLSLDIFRRLFCCSYWFSQDIFSTKRMAGRKKLDVNFKVLKL